MSKGWRMDSLRHSLARKGIETKRMGKAKDYYLLKKIMTTGHRNPEQVIDHTVAHSSAEALNDFRNRDDLKRELKKADLMVVEVKTYLQ